MKKLILLLVVVGALGYGAFFSYQKWQAQQRRSKLSQQLKCSKVESRDIHFAINAAGDIGPADQVSVRPEVNGRIAELPVDIGDPVTNSALLCRLDDSDLQIERSSCLTDIAGNKLQLEKATRNYERAKQLFAENLIAKEVFDDAKTEFELASNNLERSDKALRLVEYRLSKTKILAPFDCTILTRPCSIGQAVSGSGGFNSGTEIMTIANLKDMIITAHISQADVTHLRTNQSVEIEVESVPGLKMSGVVERIAPQATIKNNLKGFSARIAIKTIDPRVRPGMTANLSIPVDAAEGVLAVPLAAVFTERGERFAYVKKGDLFERRPIQIGITDYNFAEVTTGLLAGESVALEQPDQANDAVSGATDKKGGKGRGGRQGGSTTNATTANATAPRRPSL